MLFTIHHNGRKTVPINTDRYVGDQLYVEVIHAGEPSAALSACLPELQLADDEFAFKTYSENAGLFQEMLRQSAIEVVRTGRFHLGAIPICRLKEK